jgi:hypothetical protein
MHYGHTRTELDRDYITNIYIYNSLLLYTWTPHSLIIIHPELAVALQQMQLYRDVDLPIAMRERTERTILT